MTWLYVFLVAVIVVAFVGMLRLRRAADRAWRIHQIVERRRQLYVRIIADTAGFAAGMRAALGAAARLQSDLHGSRGPLEKVGRQIDEMAARIRKAMRESIPELRDQGDES